MRIGVLTSSRADYGIYLPLLKKLNSDPFFELRLIVFGTHLSPKHGYTLTQIEQDGFKAAYCIETAIEGDSPMSIAKSMGKTIIQFADFWNKHLTEFELIFCLGDRYEMYAAVSSAIPFSIKFAHIMGGETTLGAFDNIFRHCITHSSSFHFTTTPNGSKRVAELIGDSTNVYTVGAIALDNLKQIQLLSIEEFRAKYGIDLSIPTIVITFHPETINFEKTEEHIQILLAALRKNKMQKVISMPNADTHASIIRNYLVNFAKEDTCSILVESFGTQGYFSCLKYSRFVLGNSSSGIVEAASFGKYVINIGDRQKGRECGANVIHVPIEEKAILDAINKIETMPILSCYNIYGDGSASEKIVRILKTEI